MGNVISFSELKQHKFKQAVQELPNQEINQAIELLCDQIAIMNCLYYETEEMLKKLEFDPREFQVDKEYLFDFLGSNMLDDFTKEFEGLRLSFYKKEEDVTYKTLAIALVENETVNLEASIYKWDGIEWLAFNGEDWHTGPGADFF